MGDRDRLERLIGIVGMLRWQGYSPCEPGSSAAKGHVGVNKLGEIRLQSSFAQSASLSRSRPASHACVASPCHAPGGVLLYAAEDALHIVRLSVVAPAAAQQGKTAARNFPVPGVGGGVSRGRFGSTSGQKTSDRIFGEAQNF
jgi:hypothetical protein